MVSPWIVILKRDAHCIVIEGSYGSVSWLVSALCSALSNKIEVKQICSYVWPTSLCETVTSFIGVNNVNKVEFVPFTGLTWSWRALSGTWKQGMLSLYVRLLTFSGGSQVLIILLGNMTYMSIPQRRNMFPMSHLIQKCSSLSWFGFPTSKENIIFQWRDYLKLVREHVGRNVKIITVVDMILLNQELFFLGRSWWTSARVWHMECCWYSACHWSASKNAIISSQARFLDKHKWCSTTRSFLVDSTLQISQVAACDEGAVVLYVPKRWVMRSHSF